MEDTKALPRLRNEQETQKKDIDVVLGELSKYCEHLASQLDKRTEIRQQKVAELNQQLAGFGVQLAVEPLAIRAHLDSLTQKYATGAKIYGELNSFAAQERRYHRRLAKGYENLRADLINGFRLFLTLPNLVFSSTISKKMT